MEFSKKHAQSVITTHYGELKTLEYTDSNFKNACVEFDTESLSPTYKLIIGIPGLSNAISIASNLGIAPFVIPITNDDIFVVGGDVHMTRYNFSTGKITDSFANKASLTPEGFEINGGAYLTLNKNNYLIYPYCDYNTTGHAYNLTKVNSNYDFSSMELMWEFPKGSIGSVNSATMQAEVDYVAQKGGDIVAIEVKSGVKGSMRSLDVFMGEHPHAKGMRTSAENFGQVGNVDIVPIYALGQIWRDGNATR